MDSHEESSDHLDTTMAALTTDIAELTPQSGKGEIDHWISTLSNSENTTEIVALLQQLKTQLESGAANASELQQVLLDLANHTHEMSVKVGPEGDMATRLEALASAMQTLAGQLANA